MRKNPNQRARFWLTPEEIAFPALVRIAYTTRWPRHDKRDAGVYGDDVRAGPGLKIHSL